MGVEADKEIIKGVFDAAGLSHGLLTERLDLQWMFEHVCLHVEIDGAVYRLDPSFKQYRRSEGIIEDIKQACGYDRDTYWAQPFLFEGAGKETDVESSWYVKNLDEDSLRTMLDTYSVNVLTYLRNIIRMQELKISLVVKRSKQSLLRIIRSPYITIGIQYLLKMRYRMQINTR